jgi:hypothetical protein
MNLLIGGAVGLVLAVFGVVGGTAAYNGSPDGVSQTNLYKYSDS